MKISLIANKQNEKKIVEKSEAKTQYCSQIIGGKEVKFDCFSLTLGFDYNYFSNTESTIIFSFEFSLDTKILATSFERKVLWRLQS